MASVFKRGGRANRDGLYYVAWRDHNGKRRTKCAQTSDKAAAQRIANKHEAEAALRRDGVIDSALDAIGKESQRTIDAHLGHYEAKLRAAGRSGNYIDRTVGFVGSIAAFAGFQTAADISADGVNRYAARMKDEGRSARTIQAHLTAVKGFTRWLSEGFKLPRDPLASVRKPNPETDRRRERRMLLPDEWPFLRDATASGPEGYGVTGAERVLLYETAIQTGLRANELRSLTRGRLSLDGDNPFITCKAGSTKNAKPAKQYIRPDLAARLRLHVATKAPKAPVFKMPRETDVAQMLRDDLAAARSAWIKAAKDAPQEYARRTESDFLADVNHDGELLDFHALRHTCGAWLALAGEYPTVVQKVMRHSTITLTMGTYGHLFPGQEAGAVGKLPNMTEAAPAAFRATGTDAARPEGLDKRHEARSAWRSALAAERGVSLAAVCEGGEGAGDATEDETRELNCLPVAGLCVGMQSDASECDSGRGGNRTRTPVTGQGILSQPADQVNHRVRGDSAAPGAARSARNAHDDPDLQAIIDAWPGLPEAVKLDIVTMATAARDATGADQ